MTRPFLIAVPLFACLMFGCSGSVPQPVSDAGSSTTDSPVAVASSTAVEAADPVEQTTTPKRAIRPLNLGIGSGQPTAAASAAGEPAVDSVMEALRPLQILLGQWNGVARRAFVEAPEWVWDLQSDPEHPALAITSPKGVYLKDGRLTFDVATQQFVMTATDLDGNRRELRGTYTEPVRDEIGDDKKLQRTYRLELTQTEPADGELWRIALAQQNNNRYLLEVDRKRGGGEFLRYDTVNTQREGTSFALSDSDYGDRTCIISQGLGTITVSYQGKSYYVCCTGCQAAFNDDPVKWIAKWEAKQKAMKAE